LSRLALNSQLSYLSLPGDGITGVSHHTHPRLTFQFQENLKRLTTKSSYYSLKNFDHKYRHLIFDKRATDIHQSEGSLFNKWHWENWLSTSRRLKLEAHLSLCTKINSKWIKKPNERPKTVKLLQGKK
jgi:hypothetical protein